jgi:hypothetical protein
MVAGEKPTTSPVQARAIKRDDWQQRHALLV